MGKDIETMGKDIEEIKSNYQVTSQQLEVLENEVAKLSNAEQKIPSLFMLPDRTVWFSGRESELDNLHALLQVSVDINDTKVQITSVCGLGGCGKTSLAAEYAHRQRDFYQGGVFWFSGEDEEKFANSLDEPAVYFGTLLETSPGRTLIKTLELISRIEKPWLIVLDDMDEFKLSSNIGMLLSGPWKRRVRGSGHILITTRRKPKAMSETIRGFQESQCLQLECFSSDDGRRFVFNRTGISPDEKTVSEADTLVETLGGLPLALEQACAYISILSCTLDAYLQQYNQYSIRLLKDQEAAPASQFVAKERLAVHTTWLLNFDHIKQSAHGKFAARFFHACAFFDPAEIQKELINPGKPAIEDEAYQAYIDSPLGSSHILKLLTDFSLFKESRNSISVHRLVQEVIRDNFQPEEYVLSFVDAVRFLCYAFSRLRSPDELLTSVVTNRHDRASLQAIDPSLFYNWYKMCFHAHEVRKLLSNFLKSSQVLDQRIVTAETARLVYECALHFHANNKAAEAKEAVDFAYKIIRSGNSSLTKEDLKTLFPHEIPLPELVRRVISYSCIAPRDDANSFSCVEKDANIISTSDLKEQGNDYFKKGNFQKAVETYTSAITLTDETSSFDPTLLSNRASAFIRLEKFEDALRDADAYITHRPNCCKGYARKALALHGLNRHWDAYCAAALAYYFEKNIFNIFEPFKNLFLPLKDRIHICGPNISSLASIFYCNSPSENEAEIPRKIVILEPGDYFFKTPIHIGACDSILTGIEDVSSKRSALLHFHGGKNLVFFRRILAQNVSFSFDSGCVDIYDDCNANFVNCHFTSNAEQCDEAVLSSGVATFTACHFENCRENALSTFGKTFINKCVFSASGECGVRVLENGELEMKESKAHGNKVGVHMMEESRHCLIVDCEIYDNRLQGIVTNNSFDKHILRNRIYQNDRHGIYMEGESFTHIEENEIFENCWNGIATMYNARCKVIKNKVYRNKHGGIQVVPIGPGPEECHSVVENNEIFENCGPAIYDKMVFSDHPSIPRERTLNEFEVFENNRDEMRTAKCKQNKERNNNKAIKTNFEDESETLNFCAFCCKKKPLRHCKGCYSVGYCNKKCQRNDWRTKDHKKICSSLLQESSFIINVLPKHRLLGTPSKDDMIQLIFNQQAPGLDPKGPEYAESPKYGKRFIVKVQAGDSVRQSNLCSSLLVIYDRSMNIHGDLDKDKHRQLYDMVHRCGKNSYGIGWSKMFFWAVFSEPNNFDVLRIFTKRLPPYQNW